MGLSDDETMDRWRRMMEKYFRRNQIDKIFAHQQFRCLSKFCHRHFAITAFFLLSRWFYENFNFDRKLAEFLNIR